MSKRDRLSSLLNKKDSPQNENTEIQSSITTAIQEIASTEIQEPVDEVIQVGVDRVEVQPPAPKKRKATFDMDLELHTELKVFAAKKGKSMVDIVEDALRKYMV